ncbi:MULTISPECIES: lipid II flippase MurJ [Arthrobacter]|uniref:Lipid II flippase MurJ n=3 Tax=Arthrobacter TaxID=1663 RepID=A0ABU9KMY9_9MICC|nr:lipid II flippase MurJ [Arthrobacter sp. YJM1]MDP5226859.1 lipid II flippase MurJ [Arthrobacter sp. YJM1]
MAAGTLISRVLGFVKSWLLILAIGLGSSVTDTFINANNLPNMVFVLVAGGVFNAVLVPQIIKASRAPDRGADYLSRLLTLGVIVMFVLTAVVTVLARPLIQLTTSDYGPAQLNLAVVFAVFCLPQIFFYGLYALLTQVLNAHGAFAPAMWAPIVNNVVAIGGLGMFIVVFGSSRVHPHTVENWGSGQTILVAGFSTLGVAVQTALLFLPVMKLKLGLRPRFGWRGVGLGHAARLSSWALLTTVVSQLAFLYVMKVATIPGAMRAEAPADAAPIAGNAVLEIASQLYFLPHSIVALSLATVMFNRMAQASLDNNLPALRSALSNGLRTVAVAIVFSAIALLVLAGPIGMFFSAGKPQDGALLAITLSILALTSPCLSINFMMTRVFYSREDAKTPFLIQAALAVVNVVGALIIQFLPPEHIIYSIAVLYSIGNILSVLISAFFLRRFLGHLDGPRIVNSYIRMGYAGIGSALVGGLVLWLFGGYRSDGFLWHNQFSALLAIIVAAPLMLAAYVALLRVFRVEELRDLLRPLLARFIRPAAAPATQAAEGTTAGGAASPATAPSPAVASVHTPSSTPPSGTAPRRLRAGTREEQAATGALPAVSMDTGVLPRISGGFDAESFRAVPSAEDVGESVPSTTAGHPAAPYYGVEPTAAAAPATGLLGRFRSWLWAPSAPPRIGRHSYQGKSGENPHFPSGLQ